MAPKSASRRPAKGPGRLGVRDVCLLWRLCLDTWCEAGELEDAKVLEGWGLGHGWVIINSSVMALEP